MNSNIDLIWIRATSGSKLKRRCIELILWDRGEMLIVGDKLLRVILKELKIDKQQTGIVQSR